MRKPGTPTRAHRVKRRPKDVQVDPATSERFIAPIQFRSYQLEGMVEPLAIDPTTGRPRYRFVICPWARRLGKTWCGIFGPTLTSMAVWPGVYVHLSPTFTQGRRNVWRAPWFKSTWEKFPEEWNISYSETEQYVRMQLPGMPESILYIGGADDELTVDKYRGMGPNGTVYSEAADMTEMVWSVMGPAFTENRGWQLWEGTPKGKGAYFRLWQRALENPDRFYASLYTVRDAKRDAPGESGEYVVSEEAVAEERMLMGRSEEFIQQEFYCSWEGFSQNSVWGDLMTKARQENRIRPLAFDKRRATGVMTDIGKDDPTALIFFQVYGPEIWIIDYHAMRHSDPHDTVRVLMEKGYNYARIILPHDASHERYGMTESPQRQFQNRLPNCVVDVAEKPGSVQAEIDVVRGMFHRLVFNETTCGREIGPRMPSLLEALGSYRRGYNAVTGDYSGPPVHDDNSHPADALRTGLANWQEGLEALDSVLATMPTRSKCDFDVFSYKKNPRPGLWRGARLGRRSI